MAKLDAHQRKALPSSDFAVPSKAPGSGSYPIPDASHARNALARVAQHGDPAEKRAVAAKVHAKFPGVGKGAGEKEDTRKNGSDPREPDRDDRSQSRAFQPPPSQHGGPPKPTAAQSLKHASTMRARADAPSRPASPGGRDGVSGLDRAMSAHADKLHPRGNR